MKKNKIKKINKLIEEIKQENAKLIKNKTCICCKTKINIDLIWPNHLPNPLKQEEMMIDAGTIFKISPGFGSEHDTQEYYAAICDDCLSGLINTKVVEDIASIKKKVKIYEN